jgi:hypothetical protein
VGRWCSFMASATPGAAGNPWCRRSSRASTSWRWTCRASVIRPRCPRRSSPRPRRWPTRSKGPWTPPASLRPTWPETRWGLGRAGACPARPRAHGHRHLTGGPGQRARGGMGARRSARASASGPHRSGSRAIAAQPGQPHAVRLTDAGQAVAGRSRRSDRAERPVRRRSRLRPHPAARHASPGPGPERDPLPGTRSVGDQGRGPPPAPGRRFERLIPGAELRYLKGLGHVPMSDAPQLLAGLISRQCGRRVAAPA